MKAPDQGNPSLQQYTVSCIFRRIRRPAPPPFPFRFSSREGSLNSAALASDHLSQGQERLAQEILHGDTESERTGAAGGESPSPALVMMLH